MPRLHPRLVAPTRLAPRPPRSLALSIHPSSTPAPTPSTDLPSSSRPTIHTFTPPSFSGPALSPSAPSSPSPWARLTSLARPFIGSSSRPLSAPSLGGLLPQLPALGLRLGLGVRTQLMQVRYSRGNSYQPHTLKRKRDHGFLSRNRTKKGRKILARRRQKGRRFLSH